MNTVDKLKQIIELIKEYGEPWNPSTDDHILNGLRTYTTESGVLFNVRFVITVCLKDDNVVYHCGDDHVLNVIYDTLGLKYDMTR